jgi:hypothetical protein
MDSIPTWQEGGTMPDKSISGKESCWNCFKIYQLTVDNSEFKTGSKVSTSNIFHFTFYYLFRDSVASHATSSITKLTRLDAEWPPVKNHS